MRILIAYDGSASSVNALNDQRLAGLPTETEALVSSFVDAWPYILSPHGRSDNPAADPMAFSRNHRGTGRDRVIHLEPGSRGGSSLDRPQFSLPGHARDMFPPWLHAGMTTSGVHKGGLNALYADWSAKTVPTGLIKQHVDAINTWEIAGNTAGKRWAHFQLWLEMDRF